MRNKVKKNIYELIPCLSNIIHNPEKYKYDYNVFFTEIEKIFHFEYWHTSHNILRDNFTISKDDLENNIKNHNFEKCNDLYFLGRVIFPKTPFGNNYFKKYRIRQFFYDKLQFNDISEKYPNRSNPVKILRNQLFAFNLKKSYFNKYKDTYLLDKESGKSHISFFILKVSNKNNRETLYNIELKNIYNETVFSPLNVSCYLVNHEIERLSKNNKMIYETKNKKITKGSCFDLSKYLLKLIFTHNKCDFEDISKLNSFPHLINNKSFENMDYELLNLNDFINLYRNVPAKTLEKISIINKMYKK